MIWTCTARPCRCCRISRPECWCVKNDAGVCVRCAEPMTKQPPGVAIKSGLHEGQKVPDGEA